MDEAAATLAIVAGSRSRQAQQLGESAVKTALESVQRVNELAEKLKQATAIAERALDVANKTAKQKGPQGDPGKDGEDGSDGVGVAGISAEQGAIRIDLTDGNSSSFELPPGVAGSPGGDGADGRGIRSVELRGRSLWVIYTDDIEEDVGEVIPPQTEIRRKGKKGDDYPMVMRLRDGGKVVADDYPDGEILPSQTGAGGVLTFSFSREMQIAWVDVVSSDDTVVAYADPLGGTPASGTGIPCYAKVPTPLHYNCSEVKVFAPAGVEIHVRGGRR